MQPAAAHKQASKTDSFGRNDASAGPHGIVLAPPDHGIEFVNHLSAGDGPIQLNGRPQIQHQTGVFDDIGNSPRVLQQKAFFDSVRNSHRLMAQHQRIKRLFGAPMQRRRREESPEPETTQRVMAEATVSHRESSPGSAAARAATDQQSNNTGLPDGLKSGVESLSGMSLDHVNVHYNSPRPVQLGALAYAQGRDIHVAPGQERHLPHEAWHVVQQAQGRVQPTIQLTNGVQANDDAGLEREADVMGAKALQGMTARVGRGVSVHGPGNDAAGFSHAPKPGMCPSRVASQPSNRNAMVQRRVGRADGVANMNANQIEQWLTSQGQWESLSPKVGGVIDEMMESQHQWTYGGFSSYLLVADAKALVNVRYRQGLIHGDLKGVENKADFHVDPGNGQGLRADMLAVAQDVFERMTRATSMHGAPKGQVYLRPQGAAVIKIVSQMLGEALGDKQLIEQAHRAIAWRKFKEAAVDKIPLYVRRPMSGEVLDKSVVPEHSAYMKSLVGVSGVDIKPLLGGARSVEEFNQNMLENSEKGQARLTKYLETVELATGPVSMEIFISQDRLPAVISLLQKQG